MVRGIREVHFRIKMRVLFINEVSGHTSTGKICAEQAKRMIEDGHQVAIAYGRDSYVPEEYKSISVRIGTDWNVRLHVLYTRITDKHGLGSRRATAKFLKWADEYNPDVVWLHNLHGYYINYEMLFRWIKSRPQMKVKWTLHDCWAFTGHCVHFTAVGCYKWQHHCKKCPQRNTYPASCFRDSSFLNYEKKKNSFTGIPDMTIYTPSEWLKRLVERSFLSEYPIIVDNNKVNGEVFKPTDNNFKEKYNIVGKYMILGVANVWSENKGLKDFIKLDSMMTDDCKIVLVGLSEKQLKKLPKSIIGITKTNDQRELAGIYTAADVFINASLEETFGMTGLEAHMCGTKTICYKGTACEEIALKYGGQVVNPGPQFLLDAIENIKGSTKVK